MSDEDKCMEERWSASHDAGTEISPSVAVYIRSYTVRTDVHCSKMKLRLEKTKPQKSNLDETFVVVELACRDIAVVVVEVFAVVVVAVFAVVLIVVEYEIMESQLLHGKAVPKH